MKSVFSIFRKGLQKTATSISRSLSSVFTDIEHWDDETFDDIEAILISSDFGVQVTKRLVADIRDRYERGLIKSGEDVFAITKEDITAVLKQNERPIHINSDGLTVLLLVGVNGSGKTTTAGKLAHLWQQDGKKVMLAACDTFRAAAVEQLKLWGQRVDCHVVAAQMGADPSAVAYDAVSSALARNCDLLIIDTAGRQHTKKGLMEELAKMNRVIAKLAPEAPQEVWLTIDASVGSNALVQAREFTQSAGVSGLVLTKLDGTGKGGMAVAIQEEYHLPVFFIGLGEQPEDFQPFDAEMFADAVFAEKD